MTFVEYPKMLYMVEPPHTLIVKDKEQEDEAIAGGWQLAEDFFSDDPNGTVTPSGQPAPPVPRRTKKRT